MQDWRFRRPRRRITTRILVGAVVTDRRIAIVDESASASQLRRTNADRTRICRDAYLTEKPAPFRILAAVSVRLKFEQCSSAGRNNLGDKTVVRQPRLTRDVVYT